MRRFLPKRKRLDAEENGRIVARLNAGALRENYRGIRELVPGQEILPMIKADGYGHGASGSRANCWDCPALDGFGVATLEEGAHLRPNWDFEPVRSASSSFTGAAQWTEEKGQFCESHGLTPVFRRMPIGTFFSEEDGPSAFL